MPSDLRIKHDADARSWATELFEKGYGYHAVSNVLARATGLRDGHG